MPGPGRLDGGVQGQQIGLVGDVADDQDLLGDFSHGAHRLANGVSPFLGLGAGFVGHPGRVLGMLGVAADRGVDRLQAAGDLLERGGLLVRALRRAGRRSIQLVAGGRDRRCHSRIWLITSEKRSTTELTWFGQVAELVAALDVGCVVEMPLLKLTRDLNDFEQRPNEPAPEKPAENERQGE